MTTQNKIFLIVSAMIFVAGLTYFIIDKNKFDDKKDTNKK